MPQGSSAVRPINGLYLFIISDGTHVLPNVTVENTVYVSLFSWRYNPLWLYFHSPVGGFNLLVFEVSISHTMTPHSR